MQQTDLDKMIVQLRVGELQSIISREIKEAFSKAQPASEPDIDNYFDGQEGLAEYLQCSIPSAAKIMKKLEAGGAVRVGKRFRIYKWAVDNYLAGRTRRLSS